MKNTQQKQKYHITLHAALKLIGKTDEEVQKQMQVLFMFCWLCILI